MDFQSFKACSTNKQSPIINHHAITKLSAFIKFLYHKNPLLIKYPETNLISNLYQHESLLLLHSTAIEGLLLQTLTSPEVNTASMPQQTVIISPLITFATLIIRHLKLYALISHDNTNFSTTKRLEHAFDRCSEVLLSQGSLPNCVCDGNRFLKI